MHIDFTNPAPGELLGHPNSKFMLTQTSMHANWLDLSWPLLRQSLQPPKAASQHLLADGQQVQTSAEHCRQGADMMSNQL